MVLTVGVGVGVGVRVGVGVGVTGRGASLKLGWRLGGPRLLVSSFLGHREETAEILEHSSVTEWDAELTQDPSYGALRPALSSLSFPRGCRTHSRRDSLWQ